MAKRSREEDCEEPSSPDSQLVGTPSLSEVPDAEATSNSATPTSSKFLHLDQESGEGQSIMRCSLPGHRSTLSFASYDDYEVHYTKSHLNRCLECRKNFPTEHFLSLHIEENHDAFVSAKKDRGEKIYDFFVVNDGIDHKSSMLRSNRHGHRRRSSAAHLKLEEARQRSATLESQSSLDKHGSEEDELNLNSDAASPSIPGVDGMDGLEKAMSALKFVPTSVRFGRGRGRGRGGFSRT
ncbi:hypothetical protein ACMFMG_004981 [Clarireedia jacksonii]